MPRASPSRIRARRAAEAHRGQEHGPHLRRQRCAGAPRDAVFRDVRQPWHLSQGLDGGHTPQHPLGGRTECLRWTTMSGSCTDRTTGRNPATSRRTTRRSCTHLQRLFLIEAAKYNVLPLDDRRVERFNPDLAGRPQLSAANRRFCSAGWAAFLRTQWSSIKNKSHAITAQIEVPEAGASGVIVAQGGAFGGFALVRARGQGRRTATTSSASSGSRCTATPR